jgi:D-alanyl-D-alanine carboxypeptidase/D-alanyl-D-alanine-endopeptidase (penicillin-binding protein 4)
VSRAARSLPAAAALVALLLVAGPARAAGPAATAAALDRQMRLAGPYSGALAVDLASGATLYARRPDGPRVPASVNKLYTTATALLRWGPQTRLATSALAAPDPAGVVAGDLYLLGGGDPFFGPADASRLAGSVAASGVRHVTGRVVGDESAFDSLRGTAATGFAASAWLEPLSALTYNRMSTPPRAAASAFRRALRRRGVAVDGGTRVGAAPAQTPVLAQQASPTVAEMARRTNVPSDNFAAEMLLKGLGRAFGAGGSTAQGAGVVRSTLAGLGLGTRLIDGSGLSRADRTSPRQVVGLLQTLAARPEGPAFEASLPTAGRTGTLSERMEGTAAQDRCHAKTGTLTGVSGLAGYCDTSRGALVAFAFLMNGVSTWGARRLQDRMTVTLARYSP